MLVLRTWALSLPLALVATFTSVPGNTAYVLASPGPMPMPLMNADYGSRLAPIAHITRRLIKRIHNSPESVNHTKIVEKPYQDYDEKYESSSRTHVKHTTPSSHYSFRVFRRDSNLDNLLASFSDNHDNFVSNGQDLHDLASQSASGDEDDTAFQEDAAAKAATFQQNTQDLNSLLQLLFADKGLAFYDKREQLETLLKNTVNALKGGLSDISVMTKNMPVLGPILGPPVYLTKCIIDDLVLDPSENASDFVINLMQPYLALLKPYFNLLCAPEIGIAGLCL